MIEGVIGSAFSDTMVGDDGRNVFRGEDGYDSIRGQAGNDLLYGGNGNDSLNGGAGDDELRGGAGSDYAVFYDDLPVVADLASGTATGASSGTDRLFDIENLVGTVFDDVLRGNSGANMLQGYWGGDVLEGRGGADRFSYIATQESTPAAPDLILDFGRGKGDKIDLGYVDANEQVWGDQAFQFIGNAAFTGVGGQLRWFQQNGDTIVEANTTDVTDAGAEMRIDLYGLVSLQATDFIL